MVKIIESIEEGGQRIVFEMIDLFAKMFKHFGSETFAPGIFVRMPFQQKLFHCFLAFLPG